MIGLPLPLRLRRAILIALILGIWAPVKILWELRIAREQSLLRYHSATLTPQLRDQLTQGLSIGILSGMRGLVADFIWLKVTVAWRNEEWFRMGGYINLAAALQPRNAFYWDMGGWELAWNASDSALENVTEHNKYKRLADSRFWIQKGLDIFKRGIENNPTNWMLYRHTAILYESRLADDEIRRGEKTAAAADYQTAAHYYEKALECPGRPIFLERFPALMYEKAGDDQAAYASWADLWQHLTPEERAMPLHRADMIEGKIRQLEQKLSIPMEKRFFPN